MGDRLGIPGAVNVDNVSELEAEVPCSSWNSSRVRSIHLRSWGRYESTSSPQLCYGLINMTCISKLLLSSKYSYNLKISSVFR